MPYGAYYHLMNRGHNREVLFRSDGDFVYFLKLLGRYQGRFGQHLYHYCLMNNHFHLLADCPDPAALSKWMAGLLLSYVHYYNRQYGFTGHLWQGRFKSPVVGVEDYFLSCARYIERNPVRAGLVAEPWAYAWSSCRAHARGEENALLHYNVCNVVWQPRQRGVSSVGGSFCGATILTKRRFGEEIGSRGCGEAAADATGGRSASPPTRPPAQSTARPGRVFSTIL
jgi:REP element-mobilizing transposase RayT